MYIWTEMQCILLNEVYNYDAQYYIVLLYIFVYKQA